MVEGMQEVINTILAVEKRILSTTNDRMRNIEVRLVVLERKLMGVEELILEAREEIDARL